MACPGHCWVRMYADGVWFLLCLNCGEQRPE